MDATIVLDNVKHYPVLLKEVISVISPQHGGTFIDCTFGQGGYSKEILKFKDTLVISLDRDIKTDKFVKKIQRSFPNRLLFKNLSFSKLSNLKLKNENIKGIVFDLGYSLEQIKDTTKGLSFNSEGKLNMMMGQNNFSAHDVINKLEAKEIEKILKYFGDENDAKSISKNIVKERKLKQIDTQKLVQIIKKSKKIKNYKTHFATKSFQALRIFVNREISELIYGLISAVKILKKNGVLVVVTFHSLEDKIVKHFFKSLSEFKSISRYEPELEKKKIFFKMPKKKPIIPSHKEIIESDLIEKFSHLLEIENLGLKL